MEIRKTRMRYGEEFKRNAIKLVIDGGRNSIEVAEGLGIHANIIYRWVREYKKDPQMRFQGIGN
jgi:transposase